MTTLTRFRTIAELPEDISLFVISGGPCAGKTKGIPKLARMLERQGYKVLVAPEAATKIIEEGVLPWEVDSAIFQRLVLLEILMGEEKLIEEAIEYASRDLKVIILCDRGAIDGKPYTRKGEFESMVEELELTMEGISSLRYHAVFYLLSTAVDKEECYTLANNSARSETPEEAQEKDQKTLAAWQKYHKPCVIDNSTGFDEKIERLFREICSIL